jgi:hypothetical protein
MHIAGGIMENCSEHSNLMKDIGEINANVKNLIHRADMINGRYEKHMDEGIKFREKITEHEEILKSLCSLKRWWWSSIIVIISGLLSIAIIWGSLLNRIDRLDKLHPISITNVKPT